MANVQGKFYRGETQRSGVTPTSPPNAVDEPVGPLNPPGSGSTTTYKQLGDTTDKNFIGKDGYIPVVVNENALTLQPNIPNTGVAVFGGVVFNSTTTVDIGIVKGYIVDNETNPLVSSVQYIEYAGATGVTVTTVGSGTRSYGLLKSDGTIHFQNTFPTSEDRKEMIYLFKVGHPSGSITVVANEPDFVLSPLQQFRDLFQAFNYVNEGVYPYPDASDLTFNTSAGIIVGNGINFVSDTLNPNTLPVAASIPCTFVYRTQTGAGGIPVTNIEPNNYDNAGTITTIGGGSNRSTLQYIHYSPNLGFVIQYGQTIYDNLVDAIASIGKEDHVVYENLIRDALLIGVLALTRTTTDLTDTVDARFYRADIFGQLVGSAAGTSVTTLQRAYLNSLIPQIETVSGELTIKNGGALDTDVVFAIRDLLDVDNIQMYGNGRIRHSDAIEADESATLGQVIELTQGDGLISGGIVQWTGIGYDFNVSAALARFQGIYPLNSDPDILTLTTPDATNDRIDLFILQILFDVDGIPNGMEADFITGTPAVTPIIPQINPATQIQLTPVLVTAGSTTPTLTEEVVYDENTEWAGTTAGTGTGVFNSTNDPYQGTVSVETTNIQNGFQVQFNNGSEIDISTYQTFGFQINLKASLGANQNLYVTFLDGSLAPVSNFFLINLNKSLTGYQFIGIALNAVTFTSFDVQYIRFSFVRTSGPATYSGYFLDIVKLEGGIAPPVTQNTFLNLTDTPSSYIGQASKVVSVKADETGLEFTTASGGGISGSGTTNEIAYFTGATAIASLSTATYPSLTELSYVKGVTSALQTQLNGKQATIAGTLTNGHVATIVAGVPTWQAPAAGSSNWTVVGSDIYRNSAVAIGRTTIPLNATFVVQSKVSGSADVFLLQNDSGGDLVEINNLAYYGFTGADFVIGQSAVSGSNFIYKSDLNGVNTTVFSIKDSLNVDAARWGANGNYYQKSSSMRIGTNTATYEFVYQGTATTGGTKMFGILNGSAAEGFYIKGDNGVVILNPRMSIGSASATVTNGVYIQGNSNSAILLGISNNSAVRIFDVYGNGNIGVYDSGNVILGTTTGTKFGTATTQKLSFWNKTPIIQPTTGITAAAFVANTSGIANDTATYGGYTMGQIAAALINTGILA